MNVKKDPKTGLNEYEKSYIRERAKGKPPTEAYRDSDYKYSGPYENTEAYSIEHRDRVQAELTRIRKITEERQQLSRDQLAAYILDLLIDPGMSDGIRQKYLKLYGDICGYNNNSTITLSGDIDIKQARENTINELLEECKSTKKP